LALSQLAESRAVHIQTPLVGRCLSKGKGFSMDATRPHSARSSSVQLLDNHPNPRRTIEALREMGYDSYASVLDLIDNSIDAQANDIQVNVIDYDGDIVISIEDNGCGMDEETLSEALRLGSDTERDTADLGKFGMGMVTASIGLSRKVEVYTKEEDGIASYGGFDLDQIIEENRFVKWVQPAESMGKGLLTSAKGTVVRLSKTDRITNHDTTQFANILRKRIGQTFRKFLMAGVRIAVNKKLAEPIDVLMLNDSKTKLMLETELEVDGQGSTVTLRVVELPDYGAAGNKAVGIIPQNSGFYVLRNNREIIEAVTFDFYKKHGDVSHFRAELSFDGSLDHIFHTDVKKMTINPPQSFMDRLRQATQGLITEISREGRKRANVEKGTIDHSVAETNIVRRAPLIPKPKALVEKRAEKKNRGTHPRSHGDRPRTPHLTNLKTISGLKVVFNEGDYGQESPFYQVRQEGRTIIVTYNREHPFWRELLEHAMEPKFVAIIDYLVFALANAELLVPEQAAIVKTNVNSTLVGLLV